MSTCSIWKLPNQLGTGSITNNATSITSVSVTTGAVIGTGRNVQIMITSSSDAGKVFPARVIDDGGTSLTISANNPYAT